MTFKTSGERAGHAVDAERIHYLHSGVSWGGTDRWRILHPSAFGWLNAKGALGLLTTIVANPALSEIVAGGDPILVVVDGTENQIHAASRTRISGLIMQALLVDSLGRAASGPSTDAVTRH